MALLWRAAEIAKLAPFLRDRLTNRYGALSEPML